MFKVYRVERNYQNKTFRFPKSMLNRLEGIADKERVTLNELVRQCIEYALSDMEDKK